MKILVCVSFFGCVCTVLWAVDIEAFRNPQRSNCPETWFHLIGGNVSKEGLEADLDAVEDAGISGIHLFHGRSNSGAWPKVRRQIQCLGPEWDDLVRFVADGCKKRGLVFKMQNCPGWSMSGGPWIASSNAMRNLTYSRTDLKGGAPVDIMLPLPRKPAIEVKMSDGDRDYNDLFVLAFPTPDADKVRLPEPKMISKQKDTGNTLRLRYRFPYPVAVRSVELPHPRALNRAWTYDIGAHVSVRAEYDGGKRGRTVIDAKIPNGCWQDNVPFTASATKISGRITPSDTWVVTFTCRHPLNVPFVRFHAGLRNHNWEGKAGWVLRGICPEESCDTGAMSEMCVKSESIIDITDKFRDGYLKWTPPGGDWTVLRVGHVNNGAKNAPAPPEATGWECNKMDRRGVDAHFAAYIGRLVKGPLSGGLLNGFVVDSWECRRQTWTEHLERDFRNRRGYDFRKKLPAVFGWVIDSPSETDTFLRDWRKTLGELIELNYYARMAEIARENGLSVQYEAAFGDVLPGDILSFWKYCDTPMTEFWFPRSENGGGQDNYKPIIPCASSAHVYGKSRVSAEAFTTTHLSWAEDLKRLKACANHAFARGVTHLVFHTYTHNPQTEWKCPGTSFGMNIGTPFIRGQTWWKHMPEFTAWAARCCLMLESGKPANDILWFLGEEIDHKPDERSPFPHGYKYDYVNRDALINRITVKNGLFTAPDGATWKVMWVPPAYRSHEASAKLRELSSMGGKIVYGHSGTLKDDILRVIDDLVPDVICGPDAKGRTISDWRRNEQQIEWIHRRDKEADLYFLSANGMDPYKGEVTFRAVGNVTVWDPVTGEVSVPRVVRTGGGRTTILVDLASCENTFVVFSPKEQDVLLVKEKETIAKEDLLDIRELKSWMLSFPAGWGAPESFETDRLASWTEFPLMEEGRHFSGTVTYRAKFEGRKGEPAVLDLGDVEFAADVRLNGEKVRTLWSPPYRCDIGKYMKDGINELSIGITSTWFNRLVYDAGVPEEDRKTWTVSGPKKGSPLKPAGLLGPVTLRCGKRQ